MDRRFDIVRTGASWTIGAGARTIRGYISSSAALRDALELAAEDEAAGHDVEVFVWDGTEPRRVNRNRTAPPNG